MMLEVLLDVSHQVDQLIAAVCALNWAILSHCNLTNSKSNR